MNACNHMVAACDLPFQKRMTGDSCALHCSTAMSARNWATCPQCKSQAKSEHADRIEAWKASYGKVSPQEYEDNRPPEKPPATDETLREDYELWIDDCLKFHMYYHASCEHCGLDFSKKIEESAVQKVG